MNRKKNIIPKLLVLAGLSFSIFVVLGMNFQRAEKAPDFALKNYRGEIVRLSSLKGKVVVVNFWATWCGPCRAEIPGFLDVYKQLKPQDFEIVGMSLDEDGWESVQPFVKKYNISYPVVLGNSKIIKKYGGVEAIPTTFIIDRNGMIVTRHVGYLSKDQLTLQIKKLL